MKNIKKRWETILRGRP